MRILTCTGYYETGSSAITDFFSEFTNVTGLSDYEFRFVQDPEGISDLEYNLVENHHRHNSGHALKRYRQKVDFLAGNYFIKRYEPFFYNQWKKISYDYINELIDFEFPGYWHQDVVDKGYYFWFSRRLVNKICEKLLHHSIVELPHEVTLCSSPTEDKFLKATRKYIDRLFMAANRNNNPYIMVDQIVPPSNLQRYLRYFNDIKVFVVDRDPRDIFLAEKYIHNNKTCVPTNDINVYCQWYDYTRAHRKYEIENTEKSMLLYFEDMIYYYDEMKEKMLKWVGLTEKYQKDPFGKFNPEISIKNTRLWDKIPLNSDMLKELDIIEKKLENYLYKK